MTSLSLRNRQTTLWSMLQRTSRNVRRAWMSDSTPAIIALLSTCAILASGHAATADDNFSRATLTAPTHPLSGPAPESALRPTPLTRASLTSADAGGFKALVSTAEAEGWHQAVHGNAEANTSRNSRVGHAVMPNSQPAAMTGPIPKKSRSSVGQIRSTTSVRQGSKTQKMERGDSIGSAASEKKIVRVSAEDFVDQPANILPPEVEAPSTHPETWGQEYATHVDDVLTCGACRCEQESVGVWWNRRLPHIEIVTIEPGQLKAAARDFMIDHTLPPEHDYDVDIYDQKPIAVASAQVNLPINGPAATNDSNDADEPGKNRLKTDIRKIRPTLSYAMRNIEESQLPEGFHQKLDQGEYVVRQASPAVLQWAPTNMYYHPLYFEDPSLERYGHTYHPVVQPFASAGRFATQLVGLPYQMALHPVHSREYALGYYRPGECAPKKHYQIPFNEEAAIVQAAAMVGFFLIFP
jgi:hypothetical protein